MGLTYRKHLFAKHFAKTRDRRASVESAGYAPKDWKRTASRLLTDPEVLALLEKEQDKEAKREQSKRITRADVVAELCEMLEAASDKPGRSGWSARLKVLEVLARVLPAREEAQPSADAKPLSGDEIQQRIATLEAQLGPQEANSDVASPAEAANSPEPRPSVNAAPQAPQSATMSRSEVEPKPPALNMPLPQSPNERQSDCPQHGVYLSVRRGRPPAWTFCPKCSAEAAKYERWLGSLMPVGRGK